MARGGFFEAFLSFCRVARQWLSVTRSGSTVVIEKRNVVF